jgi:hypothetical protein
VRRQIASHGPRERRRSINANTHDWLRLEPTGLRRPHQSDQVTRRLVTSPGLNLVCRVELECRAPVRRPQEVRRLQRRTAGRGRVERQLGGDRILRERLRLAELQPLDGHRQESTVRAVAAADIPQYLRCLSPTAYPRAARPPSRPETTLKHAVDIHLEHLGVRPSTARRSPTTGSSASDKREQARRERQRARGEHRRPHAGDEVAGDRRRERPERREPDRRPDLA